MLLTLYFERESDVSLAIGANVLRVAGEPSVRVRDSPRLSGVSKEAIAMALSFLEKRGYIVIEADPPASRTKVVRLTPKGRTAKRAYHQTLGVIEQRWQARFSAGAIRNLRESLDRLAGDPAALFRGIEPYPDGWRASVPKPDTLPNYPMVLHRGGCPDGS